MLMKLLLRLAFSKMPILQHSGMTGRVRNCLAFNSFQIGPLLAITLSGGVSHERGGIQSGSKQTFLRTTSAGTVPREFRWSESAAVPPTEGPFRRRTER